MAPVTTSGRPQIEWSSLTKSCARRDDFEILGIHHRPSGHARGVVSAPQLHQLGTNRRLLGVPERREGTGRRTVVLAEELHDVRRSERVIEAVEDAGQSEIRDARAEALARDTLVAPRQTRSSSAATHSGRGANIAP